MNTSLKYSILLAIILVCAFGITFYAKADTHTFNYSDIYGGGSNTALPTQCVSPCSCGDGQYAPTQTTANNICKIKGYDSATNFITGTSFVSPYNNYYRQGSGSGFVNVCALSYNPGSLDGVTCTKITCTANATKQCSGNAVYWYDSCGTKGTLYQQCTSTQTCANAQCVNNCTSHTSMQCSGNAVYWYDSCGTKQDLYLQCASNQVCQGTQCLNVACSSNSQCGTNAYTGSPYCQGNSAYKNYITYSCNNPGTSTAYCSNSLTPQLTQTCSPTQSCINGSCANQAIACTADTDCGTDAYTGSPFCQSSNVYQNYITYTCNNPGTQASTCSNATAAQLKTTCTSSQTCTNGSCATQNITCSANTDCGTNAYTGSPYCQGSNVYQNYLTFTCNNPGTSTSTCSNNTAPQLKTTCTGNQTCNGGTCGQNCTQNSYQQCQGNYLYWYDSCGNQGTSTYCPNGCSGNTCTTYNNYITVQTNSATNVNGNQATLNGYLNGSNNNNNSCVTSVWFQYGPTTSYGLETNHQTQNYSGAFSQLAYFTNGNTTNHFRAAAQDCSGNTVYGQDMTTYNNNGTGTLAVNKTVRDLSSGAGFASSTSSSPSDMLMFMITLQNTGGQDVQNVMVRDYLPANLIYNNQLVVACTTNNSNYSNCSGTNYNYTGSISNGVNLNTIYAGQTVTITYQVQVAGAANFSYGTTTLNNNVSVTSSNGSNPSASASVMVTRGAVLGASTVATGLTNNFWVDSFFLPLLMTLILIWMWRSGMFFGIERWFDSKNKQRKGFKTERELQNRIAQIQKTERA